MHYIRDMSSGPAHSTAASGEEPRPEAPSRLPQPGCTCARLRRLTRRITAVYDHSLSAVGLRVTQYSLLANLMEHGAETGIALSDLAEHLDMDRTTLTRNLKPLLDAGWAETVASPADARVRLARITRRGIDLLRQARPHWRRAQDEVVATLGHEQVLQLNQWLDAVIPSFRPAQPGEAD